MKDPVWHKYIQDAINHANDDPPLGLSDRLISMHPLLSPMRSSIEECVHQQCVENSEVRNCTSGFLNRNRWDIVGLGCTGCCWMLLEYWTDPVC